MDVNIYNSFNIYMYTVFYYLTKILIPNKNAKHWLFFSNYCLN